MFSEIPLSKVTLTDSLYVKARDAELRFIRKIDVDRVLCGFRRTAGIDTGDVRPYGGWEDSLIAGHCLGHYFSAAAQAVASFGGADKQSMLEAACDSTGQTGEMKPISAFGEKKDENEAIICEIADNLSRVVRGLRECQKLSGSGFLSAATVTDPGCVELQFDIEEGKAEGKTWVPWYALHKVLQGMIDVYRLIGDEVALEVVSDLGSWVCDRVLSWSEEVRERILKSEYGGMNDALYQLYMITRDRRFFDAAVRFDDTKLFREITSGEKKLSGIHANTTIPKFIGALSHVDAVKMLVAGSPVMMDMEHTVGADHPVTSDTNGTGRSESGASTREPGPEADDRDEYLNYAKAFFRIARNEQTFATGGISDMEHFRDRESLDVSRTQCNCESCCAYNMLKLSRGLYMHTGEKQYADYYEHTLRNAILGAIDNTNGATTYFSPMGTGYHKLFGNPDPAGNLFWCCTGTGMEDFTKLQDSIYYINDGTPVVNQYIASEADLPEMGIKIRLSCDVRKSDVAELICECGDRSLQDDRNEPGYGRGISEILLRIPDWADSFDVDAVDRFDGKPADSAERISGESEPVHISGESDPAHISGGDGHIDISREDGYVRISGLMPGVNRFRLKFPMSVRAIGLPGNGAGEGADKETLIQTYVPSGYGRHFCHEAGPVAFAYGPTLLAMRLGDRRMDEVVDAGIDVYAPAWKIVGDAAAFSEVTYAMSRPIFLENEILSITNGYTRDDLMRDPGLFFKRNEGDGLSFTLLHTDAADKLGMEPVFIPYNEITKNRYGIYWYFQ